MEVIIEATALGESSGNRGVGRYVRGLVSGLAETGRCSTRLLTLTTTDPPLGAEVHRVSRLLPERFRPLENELRLPGELRRIPGEVVHSAGTDPALVVGKPSVTTLYDLIPLLYDDPDLARRRRRFRRLAKRHRRADHVVAISRFTASNGIEHLGIDPDRVTVALLGVDNRFTPDGPRPGGTDEPYVLMVGEYSRRKGFAEAFAVAGAVADAGLPHRLRVAGRIAPWVEDTIDGLVARSPHPERIDLLGFVDDLPALYRGASAVLVTSRFEGFGFPALESMASGTPVVSFDNSSLPEVIGEAGLLVTDGDVCAVAEALVSLLRSPAQRIELAERGVERAARFTWRACADIHMDAYEAAAGSPR